MLLASLVILGISSCTGQDNPVVGYQVWEGKDPTFGYRYSARYPQLTGLPDEGKQRQINERMKKLATDMVQGSELRDRSLPNSYIEITSDVTMADHGLVSVAYFKEEGSAGNAHPALAVETISLDLRNGDELPLSALFVPDSDYLEVLARETTRQLGPKLVSSLGEFREELAPKVENYSTFTLRPTGLSIYFSGCRLSCAGANTSVVVPYPALQGLIVENGPLGWASD